MLKDELEPTLTLQSEKPFCQGSMPKKYNNVLFFLFQMQLKRHCSSLGSAGSVWQPANLLALLSPMQETQKTRFELLQQ